MKISQADDGVLVAKQAWVPKKATLGFKLCEFLSVNQEKIPPKSINLFRGDASQLFDPECTWVNPNLVVS